MCLTSVIWGQNAITTRDLPYLCDFEDPTECAAWKMNPGVDLISTNNEWVIGDAIAYASISHYMYRRMVDKPLRMLQPIMW